METVFSNKNYSLERDGKDLENKTMKRFQPEKPLVGVGGILFRGDEVLLIKRGFEPSKGKWTFPGGLVEKGETLKQALKREMLEETNLVVESGPFVGIFEKITRDDDGKVLYHYVVVDMLCRYVEGELKPGDDAEEAAFVPIDRITEFNASRDLVSLVSKAILLKKNKDVS